VADLRGRRVLITGASSGIGAATARTVAAAGAYVALLARRAERLRALADETGGVAVPADVTDRASVVAAVEAAAETCGGLDAVVNNAGVMRPGTIADADPDDWRSMLDVNVLGLLHVTQACIPHLRAAGGGNIVNLSSMSGRRLASATSTVYSATKFAVHTISDGLRRELHADRIRVSIIAPGFVETPLFTDLDDTDLRAEMERKQAELGLTPEAVAAQVSHVLAAPPEVTVHEVALLSTDQG
jgi:clavulanate-9-aldehyde reducatase